MTLRSHGPENAEFEIRKAYNVVTESAVPYFWETRRITGIDPREAINMYKHSYNAYRKGNKLAAERWARASKHLGRAFTAESKIAYLEAHANDLPHLDGASPDAFDLHERSDTTADLINSVAENIPPGLTEIPKNMLHYLTRARLHLGILGQTDHSHELLRAERIRAAHEYGRVLEIMALAYEAESSHIKTA